MALNYERMPSKDMILPTPSPPSHCHFLALPPEMRLNIYDIVIRTQAWITWTTPALANTCRQIQSETLAPLIRFLRIELAILRKQVQSMREASKTNLIDSMCTGDLERLIQAYFAGMRCKALLDKLLGGDTSAVKDRARQHQRRCSTASGVGSGMRALPGEEVFEI